MVSKSPNPLEDLTYWTPTGAIQGFHDQQQTPPVIPEQDNQRFGMTFSNEEEFPIDNDSLSIILSHFPPRCFDDDSFSFSSHDEDEKGLTFVSDDDDDDDLPFSKTLTIEFAMQDDQLTMMQSPLDHHQALSTPRRCKITSRNRVPSLRKWRRTKHTRRLQSILPGR